LAWIEANPRRTALLWVAAFLGYLAWHPLALLYIPLAIAAASAMPRLEFSRGDVWLVRVGLGLGTVVVVASGLLLAVNGQEMWALIPIAAGVLICAAVVARTRTIGPS
jgi:hypothetical protein